MSFYTTLSFYRGTPPPKLTGADLAAFVTMFAALELGKAPDGDPNYTYGIKFGRSIDQDEEPMSSDDPPVNGISVVNFPEYDAEGQFTSLAALADDLKTLDGTIYRAYLGLGLVSDPIFEAVCRQPSAENSVPLKINGWSLEVGPIVSHSIAGDEAYLVGWIAVSLS
jgi:hypothetical protein